MTLSEKPRAWKQHNGPVLDSVNGFDVIECTACGFKHIIPIPTAENLDEVYRMAYYSEEKPLYLERSREDLEWWNIVYRERYDFFEKKISGARKRILDIGSGPGFFLLYGKQNGWDTVGIEPSKQAAEHSRGLGLEIVEEFLTDETAAKLGTFDVVHMSEVLEHIPDPHQMVRLAHSLSNKGGLLCVVVPNDYNPIQQALRTGCRFDPWWVAPPHHVNYFNFDSLRGLLEKNGFEVLHQESTFPIDIFLLMGENYVGNDALGRRCHAMRKTFEINLAKTGMNDVKRELYRKLAELGLGRESVMIGKK